MKEVILLVLLGILINQQSNACETWNEERQLQVFHTPLFVGASITANLTRVIPAYNTLTAHVIGEIPQEVKDRTDSWWMRKLGIRPEKQGSSPSHQVARKYRLAEILRYTEARRTEYAKIEDFRVSNSMNLSRKITTKYAHIGTGQIESFLGEDAPLKDAYKESSIIMGIDLFYWDAVLDYCGHGGALTHNVTGKRVDTEHRIRLLTEQAKQDGKVLMLGTVPYDSSEKVFLHSHITGWNAPDPSCVYSINSTLRYHCREENNCYIVDLEEMVEKLYAGEKLSLKGGSSYDLYQMRPDGVHLSDKGSQYVTEQMIDMLETNPPVCR